MFWGVKQYILCQNNTTELDRSHACVCTSWKELESLAFTHYMQNNSIAFHKKYCTNTVLIWTNVSKHTSYEFFPLNDNHVMRTDETSLPAPMILEKTTQHKYSRWGSKRYDISY